MSIRYNVKVELVLCELVMERLSSHVEFVELLKVENVLMRLSAEPVVELGRCSGGESNAVPMLF